MRYFMTILLDPSYDAGKPAPKALMDAMGPYVDEQVASGTLISTAGLKRTRLGARLNGHTGRVATVDGPFAEAKEVIGGYAVLEVPDKDAAVAIGAAFVKLHIDNGMPDITVEMREIDGGYNY